MPFILKLMLRTPIVKQISNVINAKNLGIFDLTAQSLMLLLNTGYQVKLIMSWNLTLPLKRPLQILGVFNKPAKVLDTGCSTIIVTILALTRVSEVRCFESKYINGWIRAAAFLIKFTDVLIGMVQGVKLLSPVKQPDKKCHTYFNNGSSNKGTSKVK